MIKYPNEYILNEDYGELKIISDKHGTFKIKIDLEDVDKCKKFHWSINRFKVSKESYNYYAINGDIGLLHRYIMDADSEDQAVDHKDGNTLDSRKNNLRKCTRQENSMNRKIKYTNKSGVTGVCWYKKTGKWWAYIMVDYKHKSLGYYEKFEDAVQARKSAEIKYFGEYVRQ